MSDQLLLLLVSIAKFSVIIMFFGFIFLILISQVYKYFTEIPKGHNLTLGDPDVGEW